MAEGGPVSEPAPAKLNVFLRVVSRRSDGFHEIETVVQPLTLADGVRVEPGPELSLRVAGDRRSEVPAGEENLVLRAAAALEARCRPGMGARLLLVKRIPVSAGLGGGSADAAAALRALNDLWGCGLDGSGLVDVAAEVGSDVPALVPGRPVMARGRGDVVEPIDLPRTWWAVVPATGVSAADAYAWWDEEGRPPGPDPRPLLEALRDGDLDAVAQYLFNDLESPVSRRRADVGEAREKLLEAGAIGAVMCGSGPSVAGLARDGRHAEEVAARCRGFATAAIVDAPGAAPGAGGGGAR